VMASAFRAHRMVVGGGEAAIFACRPGNCCGTCAAKLMLDVFAWLLELPPQRPRARSYVAMLYVRERACFDSFYV
jgi:hypothetical protein